MKTKTNKVPLVGPRGRRELLDRIEELEKKVVELAQGGGGGNVAKILTIKNFDGTVIGPIGKDDFALALGISVEELESFMRGEYPLVKFPDAYLGKIYNVSSQTAGGETYTHAYFIDFNDADYPKISPVVYIIKDSHGYSIGEY